MSAGVMVTTVPEPPSEQRLVDGHVCASRADLARLRIANPNHGWSRLVPIVEKDVRPSKLDGLRGPEQAMEADPQNGRKVVPAPCDAHSQHGEEVRSGEWSPKLNRLPQPPRLDQPPRRPTLAVRVGRILNPLNGIGRVM